MSIYSPPPAHTSKGTPEVILPRSEIAPSSSQLYGVDATLPINGDRFCGNIWDCWLNRATNAGLVE